MGFVLVAVLCAVLMALSVGRGWALDLFHAGKPIAAAAARGHLDRVPAPVEPPAEATPVSIPEELSAEPLGVSVGGPAPAVVEAQADRQLEPSASAVTLVDGADRKADRNAVAAKAARSAEKHAERAARPAERAADKAARKG